MRLALLAVLVAASPASAEGLAPYESIQDHPARADHAYALAINQPFGWPSGFAIAGSGYARLAPHHALRLNVASYDFHGNVGGDLIDIFVFGGEGSEAGHTGRILDVSAGWMYFPRRVWDGPTFELGLMHRSLDTEVVDDFADYYRVERSGRTIAARALLGWSWLIRDRAFIAVALGAAKGYSSGTEVDTEDDFTSPAMSTTTTFGEWTSSFEGYMRFGIAFGGGS
jgi:hypothetical protein